MNIYRTVPQFNQATGEVIDDALIFVTEACDFCGNVCEEGYSTPDPTYKIEESNNQDPQYYQDRVKIMMGHQEIDLDLNALAHDHPEFSYCQPWSDDNANDCEFKMMEQWVKDRKSGLKSLLGDCSLLCHVMYLCRYEVIKKLVIEDGYDFTRLRLEER